jgi:hypothetical protein
VKSHRQTRVMSEAANISEKSGVGSKPERKLVRKIKKKKRRQSPASRDAPKGLENQSTSIQDDAAVGAQGPLPNNHKKKMKKRSMRNTAMDEFRIDQEDLNAISEPSLGGANEQSVRPKKGKKKKRKRRAGTVVSVSLPIAVDSGEQDLPIKKRRKRKASKVKGTAKNDDTQTRDPADEKVHDQSHKLKKKRRKVRKQHAQLEDEASERDLVREAVEKTLGDGRMIYMVPLPISSVPAKDDMSDSLGATKREMESDAPQDVPVDEISAGDSAVVLEHSEQCRKIVNVCQIVASPLLTIISTALRSSSNARRSTRR